MRCRICQNTAQAVMTFDRVPPDVQTLLTPARLGSVHPVAMTVYQCDRCGLVQAPMQLNSIYYDDYLMSQTFSPQLEQYLDELVEDFVTRYDLKQARVLDVGCGDGAFMYPFRKRGIQVEGIEPSDRSRAVAMDAGFKVYPGYMTPDTELPGGPYDAFVTRQVLEHVDDLAGLLEGIKRQLRPGAVGIVEIPRLEKALQDLRFYDFFPDHVNYFSLETLRTALELNGFTVLETKPTMKDEYNVAVVRVRSAHDFHSVTNNRQLLSRQLETLFAESKQQGLTTAIWGAGAKGLSIMTAMDTTNLDMVIDSDANKIGLYTPVSEFLVQAPDALAQADLVVISAVAYQTVILKKLKNYNFKGTVFVIGPEGIEQVYL